MSKGYSRPYAVSTGAAGGREPAATLMQNDPIFGARILFFLFLHIGKNAPTTETSETMMAEQPGFAQFYDKALQDSLDRTGRPDAHFFKKLAGFGGNNGKYYAKLEKKDWLGSVEGARDIEPSAFFHPKIKSHFVRYYGATALNFHYMEVHARASKALTASMIEEAEKHIDGVIQKATREIDQYTAASEEMLRQSGSKQTVRYGSGPLLIPAEIVSPYCDAYLGLTVKADNLYGLLEYQRLRRLITNTACDKEFARIDRLLKSVSRSAFELARGLRARTQAQPDKAQEPGVQSEKRPTPQAVKGGSKPVSAPPANGVEQAPAAADEPVSAVATA